MQGSNKCVNVLTNVDCYLDFNSIFFDVDPDHISPLLGDDAKGLTIPQFRKF